MGWAFDLMANDPEAEWRESMYGHSTNTPGTVHETSTVWVQAGPTMGSMMAKTKLRPSQAMAGAVDLVERAAELAAGHDLSSPEKIRWARLRGQWGVCRPDGTVEIAHAASTLPSWVLDHIIVHELAHLTVPGHGPDFDELVARYPRSREATGYLLAVQDREWRVHRTPDQPTQKRTRR